MSIAVSSKMALSRKGSGQKETALESIIFIAKVMLWTAGAPLAVAYILAFLFGLKETRGGWICESRDGLVASRSSHGKGALQTYYLDGDRVSYQEFMECTWTQVPHQLDLPKGRSKP